MENTTTLYHGIIGSNWNRKLVPKAHARFQFCSDPVRSHAYFPDWKPAFRHIRTCGLRPIPTQENRHWIGLNWTFFHLVLSAPSDQWILKTLQLFIISWFKVHGTENWFRKPMRGFNFKLFCSDSMLIFLSGIDL